MAFFIPKKPPSNVSCNDDDRPAITSYLYLRTDGGGGASSSNAQPSLDAAVVLRRIRQRKRAIRLRGALESFLRKPAEPAEKDGWHYDAFSSP